MIAEKRKLLLSFQPAPFKCGQAAFRLMSAAQAAPRAQATKSIFQTEITSDNMLAKNMAEINSSYS